MTLMNYAFEGLNLERLDGDMIEYSAVSLRLYLEKCGRRKEAGKVGWHFMDRLRWNKIIAWLTKADYCALVLRRAG